MNMPMAQFEPVVGYRRSRAVPVRLTRYWLDPTCNLPALNECGDANIAKNPQTNQLRNGHAPTVTCQ